MSLNIWIDKQGIVYNGIVLGHRKEWNPDTCYKDEAWKHYAKWKEPSQKTTLWFHSH